MQETIVSINLENLITITLMVVVAFLVFSFVAGQIKRHERGKNAG